MSLILLNKYQTPITDELLEEYPKEVREQFIEYINNVPMIKSLISKDRKYAKDLPRDNKGRIIVDVCNPHILEDMDYFRKTALHFKKYGKFTNLAPNGNPNSEYGQWIRRERDRCWDGMVRESDGEWITGFMYWYMNYCPIMLSAIREGTSIGDRVEDFPETWEGIYLRFHYLDQARNGGIYNNFKGGNHAMELARRGCSKSYSLASIMAHNFVLGENRNANKRTTTVLSAYLKEYLGGKDGTVTKFIPMIDFVAQNTQFPRLRLTNAPKEMLWQMGFQDLDTGTNKGSLNLVMAVSVKDDEEKLRGKRGYILLEEIGSFPNILGLYNTLRPGVEEGDIVFGLIYGVGTSGSDASDFLGVQEILYNPKGYNVYALPNVYDKNQQGKTFFSFFYPSYINRKGCYNKDGVSDVTKALLQILMKRYEAKYNTTDPNTIIRTIAEMPITPAEAILKAEGLFYPVSDVLDLILEIESNPRNLDDIMVGNLEISTNNEIRFKPSLENPPIRSFPHKDNKIAGCAEIHVPPQKTSSGKVQRGRYVAGIDTYDDDVSQTLSLGSIYILDLLTDEIVFEYTGRPLFADDFYELCRRALIWYNAEANYENNKKGLFAYFSKMNCVYLLSPTLEFLKDKEMIKGTLYGNKAYGTISTAPIKTYGRKLQRDYLLKPVKKVLEVDGDIIEVTIPKLKTIKSIAYLKEISLWNPEGNFDRHDAMLMLMLIREDKLRLFGENPASVVLSLRETNYLGDDKFFTKNYDQRISKFRTTPEF